MVLQEGRSLEIANSAGGITGLAGLRYNPSHVTKDLNKLRQLTVEENPCLQIFTLGPAWIEWNGEPLAVFRRQARGLLYRLAVHLQPVPREEICFAFWPDSPEVVARRHLSHVLCHLRECLPVPELLRSNSEQVELDAQWVWSDACVFRAACALPDAQPVGALEQVLELYRGPLLSGFTLPDSPEFELWVARQRSAYQRMYLDALATLMSSEANRAEFTRAIRYARQYLRVDELAEAVHRQLMTLYATLGDRPSAVQQYQDCAAILERRLGVTPLPETRAVYQAILQN